MLDNRLEAIKRVRESEELNHRQKYYRLNFLYDIEPFCVNGKLPYPKLAEYLYDQIKNQISSIYSITASVWIPYTVPPLTDTIGAYFGYSVMSLYGNSLLPEVIKSINKIDNRQVAAFVAVRASGARISVDNLLKARLIDFNVQKKTILDIRLAPWAESHVEEIYQLALSYGLLDNDPLFVNLTRQGKISTHKGRVLPINRSTINRYYTILSSDLGIDIKRYIQCAYGYSKYPVGGRIRISSKMSASAPTNTSMKHVDDEP